MRRHLGPHALRVHHVLATVNDVSMKRVFRKCAVLGGAPKQA